MRVRRLRNELESLRSAYAEREDLPGLRTLVDAMSALAAEAEREILVQSRELYERLHDGSGRDEEAFARFRDKVGGLMIAFEDALPSALQIARKPHGREVEALILPFTRLVAKLIREEPMSIELIFEPTDYYGYEFSVLEELTPLANVFKPELRDLIHGMPQLIAIAYPQQLEAETLVHAIIAHEIAHTVLDYVPANEPDAPIERAFGMAVAGHYESLREALEQTGDHSEEEADDLVRESVDRLRRWYEELTCDILAIGMVGPAYVFALADLDVASHRWAQLRGGAGHDSHPGLAWRLRLTIAEARKTYLPSERPDRPAWAALRSGLADLEADIPDGEDELLLEERTLIEEALSNLADVDGVRKVLNYAQYSPESFTSGIEIVWDKLNAGIPPAERIADRSCRGTAAPELSAIPKTWSLPMDWQSILNGAYAVWISTAATPDPSIEHRTFPDDPRATKDWLEFNAYVRGTIELADLHERLTGVRERLDGLNAPSAF